MLGTLVAVVVIAVCALFAVSLTLATFALRAAGLADREVEGGEPAGVTDAPDAA